MYRDAFGLRNKPFGNTPDPAFFYFSMDHRQALVTVNQGIRDRCGLMMLLGETGTGKTTLCYHIHDHDGYLSTYLNNPYVSEVEFLQEVNRGLGVSVGEGSRRFFLDALESDLLKEYYRGKPVVLIVDEAHRLGIPVLDQILILSNLQVPKAHLLQIVLVGNPSLLNTLGHPRLESLSQRIGLRCHLGRMDYADTIDYVNFRLERAGCTNRALFSAKALDSLWKASGGTPRLINQLGERALNEAYQKGKRSVRRREVRRVAEDPLYQPIFVSRAKSWSGRTALVGTVLALGVGISLGLWYFGIGDAFRTGAAKKVRYAAVEHRSLIRKPIIAPRVAAKTATEQTNKGPVVKGATVPVLALDEANPMLTELEATQADNPASILDPLGKRLADNTQMWATADLPDIRLSAIAWDEDPDRCIAVVNDRIVHEGDFLGEVRVLRIMPDHIVLLYGNEHVIKGIHTQEEKQNSESTAKSIKAEEYRTEVSKLGDESNVEQTSSLKNFRSVINFDYRTSELAPEASEKLDSFVSLAKQNPDHEIVIFGYTDDVGSQEFNKRLSKSRATIAESYLVEEGINPERMKTIGMGEKNPLRPNTTPEGRSANRRVEIKLVPAGG
jgi:general secretion pathway protein A